MASFETATGDVIFELQNTEPIPNINEDGHISSNKREDFLYEESANIQQDEQTSGNNREDIVYEESANIQRDEQISDDNFVYEEPANTQLSGGRKEDRELQQNNWPLKCFMAMMIALLIAVVVLAVSKISNSGINVGPG